MPPQTRTRGGRKDSPSTPPAEPPAPAEPPRRSPLFREPEPEPGEMGMAESLPGPLSSPGPSPVVGEGSHSRSEAPSTGDKGPLQRITKGQLKRPLKRGLTIVGGVLAAVLATPPEQAAGLWRPDDEDQEEMSDPLASMLHRRMPAGASNDVVDGLVLVLAVLGYVGKQIARRAELRAAGELAGYRLPGRADPGPNVTPYGTVPGEGPDAGPAGQPVPGELAGAGVAS